MIKIASDKEKYLKILHELETLFSQGKISKEVYDSEKKQLNEEMETSAAIERVKRLQGKETDEKNLDYFAEKNKAEKDVLEREELLERYVKPSKTTYDGVTTKSRARARRNKAIVAAFIALIFFTGIGVGFVFMKESAESVAVPMLVNDSAFPAVSTANVTNTSSVSNTATTTTTTTTPTTTTTTQSTNTQTTPTNTQTTPTPKTNGSV
jgi:hypothetical protein